MNGSMTRMIDADKAIEWLKKMRHKHGIEGSNGTLVWVERDRVINLLEWLACGEDYKEVLRQREERNGVHHE